MEILDIEEERKRIYIKKKKEKFMKIINLLFFSYYADVSLTWLERVKYCTTCKWYNALQGVENSTFI